MVYLNAYMMQPPPSATIAIYDKLLSDDSPFKDQYKQQASGLTNQAGSTSATTSQHGTPVK
jgi:hypothetical protein